MRFPLQIQSSKNLPFLLVYMYCIFFFAHAPVNKYYASSKGTPMQFVSLRTTAGFLGRLRTWAKNVKGKTLPKPRPGSKVPQGKIMFIKPLLTFSKG